MIARYPRLALCSLAALALVGCDRDENYDGALDLPSALAVLQPEVGGPFEEPIGLVASGINGQISTLALKQGWFLADDPTSTFARGTPIATGRERRLGSIEVYAAADDDLRIFAGDHAFEQLLEIQWVRGLDETGSPIEPQPEPTEVRLLDAAGTATSGATLADLRLRSGWTSTERWTISRGEEGVWWVQGSRSGRQERTARSGEPYESDFGALRFTIEGDAEFGDRFEFDTRSGIIEHDLGGMPLSMALAPDQSVLAVVVHDRTLDRPLVHWWDPASGSIAGTVLMPENAKPHRVAWSEDGERLFVADRGRSAVWVAQKSQNLDPREIPLPWPTIDAAPLESDDAALLYVVPTEARSVWMVDLDSGELVDINPLQAGIQGMPFNTPVEGIESIPMAYELPSVDDEGVREESRSVAVSLYEGEIVFMREGTGCLVPDELGPRTQEISQLSSRGDYSVSFDGVASAPFLQVNATNSRHVVVHPCAGIAREEEWTLTFDSIVQGWRVVGSLSGEQENIAVEDQRYVSDDGAVSFVIRAGGTTSRDGWVFQFSTFAGVLTANGDANRDGQIVSPEEQGLTLPTEPKFFHYRVGPDTGAWQTLDERPLILVASQGSDVAARIEPQSGDIEVVWR